MINYRVDDLDGMIAKLQAEGIEVDSQGQGPTDGVGAPGSEDENGRFAWITDLEGIASSSGSLRPATDANSLSQRRRIAL